MTTGVFQLCGLILLEVILAFLFGAFFPMERGTKRLYLFAALLPLAMMSMFHSAAVGSDTLQYINIFERYRLFPWSRLFQDQRFEHGYLVLNWVFGQFTDNPQFLFAFIGGLLYCSLYRWMDKHIEAPGLLVILLIEMLNIDCWISAKREAVVIAILLFAFDAITEKKIIRFTLLVLLAATFHRVALSFFLVYLLVNFRRSEGDGMREMTRRGWMILAGAVIVSAVLYPLLRYVIRLFPIYSYYLNGVYMNGEARLAVIINIIVYSLMLYLPFYIEPDSHTLADGNATKMTLYVLAFFNLAFTLLANQATLIARIAGIFSPFGAAYYTSSVSGFETNKNREIMAIITVITFGLYAVIITVMRTPEWQKTYPFIWCWQNMQ